MSARAASAVNTAVRAARRTTPCERARWSAVLRDADDERQIEHVMRSLLELELRPDAERQPHAPVSRLEAVDEVDAFEVRRAEAHFASRTFRSAVTEAVREAQLGAVRIGCERGIGASLLVDAE